MHLAGHRRGGRSPESYPQSPAVGILAALPPLSRQRFIDGDTTQTGLNGASSSPFKTIAQFMASRTNVSANDASANYVGWVTPSITGGYTENVAFPAYASTQLRADSQGFGPGTGITGNVTWANIAGAFAGSLAVSGLHNIGVIGTITLTDDASAPSSLFIISADEIGDSNIAVTGLVDATTTQKLANIACLNTIFPNGITAGTGADNANVSIVNCILSGNTLSGRSIQSFDSIISVSAISARITAAFLDTLFGESSAPVLTLSNGTLPVLFDGVSWQSFSEAGGSRPGGDTGAAVIVIGGFDGGSVPGADLLGTGNTDVSLNGTGATVGYRGAFSGNHYSVDGQTGDGSATLKLGGGEKNGDTICITKRDFAAQKYDVKDNAGNIIATIASGQQGFVVARFLTGPNDWVFDRGGSLGT